MSTFHKHFLNLVAHFAVSYDGYFQIDWFELLVVVRNKHYFIPDITLEAICFLYYVIAGFYVFSMHFILSIR